MGKLRQVFTSAGIIKAGLVLILVGAADCALAQSVSLKVEATYNYFNMHNYKVIQKKIPGIFLGYGWINIPYELFNDFQPYYGYNVSLGLLGKKMGVDIMGGYNSTGSRLHYRDYSGEFTSDQIIENNHFSIGFSPYRLSLSNRFSLSAWAYSGFAFSSYALKNHIYLYNQPDGLRQDIHVKSMQWYIEPSGILTYQLGRFAFSGRAAYFQQLLSAKGTISKGVRAEWEAYSADGKNTPQWSGLRLGIGVEVLLFKAKKDGSIDKTTDQ